MTKKIPSYNIEETKDLLTSQAGLVEFSRSLHKLGIPSELDRRFLKPEKGGYAASAVIMPLLLTYVGGGKKLSDTRQIAGEPIYQKLNLLGKIPQVDSINKWLKRLGETGNSCLEDLSTELVQQAVKDKKRLVIDIDATFIASEKYGCTKGYKGNGFFPLFTHINGGYVADIDFRLAHLGPIAGISDALVRCIQKFKGKKLLFRSDSAGYQKEVINRCYKNNITFTIAAKKTTSLIQALDQIKPEDWNPYNDEYDTASCSYSMNQTEQAFRLVALRKRRHQQNFLDLVEGHEHQEDSVYKQVIATNSDKSDKAILAFYAKRADRSENKIKELKENFSGDYLPFSNDIKGNELVSRIQCLAYNLNLIVKKNVFPKSFKRHTCSTLRWKFFLTAGKLIKHGRKMILRVQSQVLALFSEVKERIDKLRPLLA